MYRLYLSVRHEEKDFGGSGQTLFFDNFGQLENFLRSTYENVQAYSVWVSIDYQGNLKEYLMQALTSEQAEEYPEYPECARESVGS